MLQVSESCMRHNAAGCAHPSPASPPEFATPATHRVVAPNHWLGYWQGGDCSHTCMARNNSLNTFHALARTLAAQGKRTSSKTCCNSMLV